MVWVVGNDPRGVLFGVGKLLREMHLQPGRASVADNLEIATAPKYRLRGHQLGYRPKCNSYDAWDLPTWEQYFRDLAVFGCNAIELIPPRSDDEADSPHFPLPPMEMMVGMSRLADSYGLDVWIWYPAMDKRLFRTRRRWSSPATNGAMSSPSCRGLMRCSCLAATPATREPNVLLALLEKQTENLHRYHPKAQMWVSPQSFDRPGWTSSFDILNRDQPAWLSGVVFGPQIRISVPRAA